MHIFTHDTYTHARILTYDTHTYTYIYAHTYMYMLFIIIYIILYINIFIIIYLYYILIFFVLNKETYEKGIEKLVAAQDTSNVENSDISSNELREKQKLQRRNNARKRINSSSSDEEDKENQIQNKKRLPSFPMLQDFVSINKVIGNIAQDISKDTLYEENFC